MPSYCKDSVERTPGRYPGVQTAAPPESGLTEVAFANPTAFLHIKAPEVKQHVVDNSASPTMSCGHCITAKIEEGGQEKEG